jgi:integrase/recombinase XerD
MDLVDFSATERWIKILGKGKRERLVPVTENLALFLQNYMQKIRPYLLREDKTLPSLLINDRGHRPSRVDVWRWLACWSERCGFAEPVNPHRFRHACATAMLENGADLRSIQMLLGHSSIQTTQVYTSVSVGSLVRTMDEHHPLAKVKIEEAES